MKRARGSEGDAEAAGQNAYKSVVFQLACNCRRARSTTARIRACNGMSELRLRRWLWWRGCQKRWPAAVKAGITTIGAAGCYRGNVAVCSLQRIRYLRGNTIRRRMRGDPVLRNLCATANPNIRPLCFHIVQQPLQTLDARRVAFACTSTSPSRNCQRYTTHNSVSMKEGKTISYVLWLEQDTSSTCTCHLRANLDDGGPACIFTDQSALGEGPPTSSSVSRSPLPLPATHPPRLS